MNTKISQLLSQGRTNEAALVAEHWDGDGSEIDCLLTRAMVAHAAGEYTAAQRILDFGNHRFPDDASILVNLVSVMKRRHESNKKIISKSKQAVNLLEQQCNPGTKSNLKLLGFAYTLFANSIDKAVRDQYNDINSNLTTFEEELSFRNRTHSVTLTYESTLDFLSDSSNNCCDNVIKLCRDSASYWTSWLGQNALNFTFNVTPSPIQDVEWDSVLMYARLFDESPPPQLECLLQLQRLGRKSDKSFQQGSSLLAVLRSGSVLKNLPPDDMYETDSPIADSQQNQSITTTVVPDNMATYTSHYCSGSQSDSSLSNNKMFDNNYINDTNKTSEEEPDCPNVVSGVEQIQSNVNINNEPHPENRSPSTDPNSYSSVLKRFFTPEEVSLSHLNNPSEELILPQDVQLRSPDSHVEELSEFGPWGKSPELSNSNRFNPSVEEVVLPACPQTRVSKSVEQHTEPGNCGPCKSPEDLLQPRTLINPNSIIEEKYPINDAYEEVEVPSQKQQWSSAFNSHQPVNDDAQYSPKTNKYKAHLTKDIDDRYVSRLKSPRTSSPEKGTKVRKREGSTGRSISPRKKELCRSQSPDCRRSITPPASSVPYKSEFIDREGERIVSPSVSSQSPPNHNLLSELEESETRHKQRLDVKSLSCDKSSERSTSPVSCHVDLPDSIQLSHENIFMHKPINTNKDIKESVPTHSKHVVKESSNQKTDIVVSSEITSKLSWNTIPVTSSTIATTTCLGNNKRISPSGNRSRSTSPITKPVRRSSGESDKSENKRKSSSPSDAVWNRTTTAVWKATNEVKKSPSPTSRSISPSKPDKPAVEPVWSIWGSVTSADTESRSTSPVWKATVKQLPENSKQTSNVGLASVWKAPKAPTAGSKVKTSNRSRSRSPVSKPVQHIHSVRKGSGKPSLSPSRSRSPSGRTPSERTGAHILKHKETLPQLKETSSKQGPSTRRTTSPQKTSQKQSGNSIQKLSNHKEVKPIYVSTPIQELVTSTPDMRSIVCGYDNDQNININEPVTPHPYRALFRPSVVPQREAISSSYHPLRHVDSSGKRSAYVTTTTCTPLATPSIDDGVRYRIV